MRLSSWLRSARSRFAPPARLAKPARRARMGVEQLGDRLVPSTFTVHNLADSGPGSLRAAITAANTKPGADVIAFAPRRAGHGEGPYRQASPTGRLRAWR